MTTNPVRWGFLGAGWIASTALAPAVHATQGAELYAAASRSPQRARGLEPRQVHESYHDLLADPSVDAVYISLTNEAHLPWILESLNAGKHVLCEKPLTLNAHECRAAFAAADDAGLHLVEATWMRWHPRYQRADTLLGAGASGALRSSDAWFSFDGVPESNYRLNAALGGGALLDLGPYVLAPVVDWCMDEWEAITATSDTNDSGADLRTTATVASSNTTANITASIADPEEQRLTVVTDTITVTWHPEAFTSWRVSSALTISDDTSQWTEEFAPCDAYQLMVEDVSALLSEDGSAFLAQRSGSERTAELIDQIKSVATPTASAMA